MNIEMRPTHLVKPYPNNPRDNDEAVAAVAASIREFGFRQPIVVDADGVIICGHTRHAAALLLGLEEVPVHVATDLSPAKVKAYRIADNRTGELATWVDDTLASEVADLRELADMPDVDLDMSALGFDDDELDLLFADDLKDGESEPDEVPDLPEEPVTQPGDMWTLGEHRVLCGDATSADDVARLTNGTISALCFTSPPYVDLRDYGGGKNLDTKHLASFIHTARDHVALFAVNLGIIRRDGAIFPFWDDYIESAAKAGLKLLSWNVWRQTGGFSIGKITAMFPLEHEFIFVFGREPRKLHETIPNLHAGEVKESTIRQVDGSLVAKAGVVIRPARALGTVFECHRATNNDEDHPAKFPVGFPSAYIEACSNRGDAVYDPFVGSGTTIIAAEQLGRRCLAMEIDPRYVDVSVRRWERFTGLTATRVAAEAGVDAPDAAG